LKRSSVTPGDYTISVADITNNGFTSTDFNENGATFTLRVTAAPSDTTAPTNASIDIDDSAAWTNSSAGSVSLDLSANDNVGVTSYKLAETQAGLASATAVPVSPAEAGFSRSNVSFTLTGSEASSKPVSLRRPLLPE
jgi:hypothetical protein